MKILSRIILSFIALIIFVALFALVIGTINEKDKLETNHAESEEEIVSSYSSKDMTADNFNTNSSKDKHSRKYETEPADAIYGNFIGKWRYINIGYAPPKDASQWDAEFRSDGTGTFYYTFENGSEQKTDFNYLRYDTYLGENFDGITIKNPNGNDIKLILTCVYSNELNNVIMTMYSADDSGTPDLDAAFVFEYIY